MKLAIFLLFFTATIFAQTKTIDGVNFNVVSNFKNILTKPQNEIKNPKKTKPDKV
ncbi:MAG: hypothetical protein ACI9XR_001417 [Flavobacterium sp.]|jgi:hypothetical protein